MTMRRCLFTPSRYRSEPEESTAKRFIADQTDPPGFTVKFINKTIEKAASSEDDENGPTPKKRKEMTAEMQSVQWSKADTDKVNHFFAKQVFDMTRYDLKGNLPGYAEIRKFLKIYPSVLYDFPMMTRIKKTHTKLFNERNKARRLAKKMTEERGVI